MNIVKHKKFGEVEALEIGFGILGPPLMTVHFYRVDDTLIDSGQSHMRRAVFSWIRNQPPARLFITHHHEDHSGNAAAIQAAFQIPVYGHPLTRAKMSRPFGILPYQHLVWGRTTPLDILPLPLQIETARHCFVPVHTPGHSKDHTVFLEKNEGWLFAGDLYLGDKIKYFRSDENIRDQIGSLQKVLQLDFDALFCAHRPVLTQGKERLQKKLVYLQALAADVTRLKQQGYPLKEVIRRLDRKEERLVKWITMGNACFANMVRSAYGSF